MFLFGSSSAKDDKDDKSASKPSVAAASAATSAGLDSKYGVPSYMAPKALTAQETAHITKIKNGSLQFGSIPPSDLTTAICMAAVEAYTLDFVAVPAQFKTQEMSDLVVEKAIHMFKYVPEHFRTEKMCESVLKRNKQQYTHVPASLQKKFWMYNPKETRATEVIKLLSTEEKDRTKIMYLDAVEVDPTCLSEVPEKFIEDAYMVASRKHKGVALLKHIKADLRSAKINAAACETNPGEFEFVPEKERTKELSISCVKSMAHLIAHVQTQLLSTIYFACVTPSNYGALANSMPQAGFADEKVCKDLVSRDGHMLRHFPDASKTQEVVDLAFKQSLGCISYIPKKLITKVMAETYIERNPTEVNAIDVQWVTEDMCIKAVQTRVSVLGVMKDMVYADGKSVVTDKVLEAALDIDLHVATTYPSLMTAKSYEKVLPRYSQVFGQIPPSVKTVKHCELYLTAGGSFNNLPSNLVNEELVLLGVKRDPSVLRDRDAVALLTQDLCNKAVDLNPSCFVYVPAQFQTGTAAIKYCKANPSHVEKLGPDALTEQTCIELVEANPDVLAYLQNRFRTEEVCVRAFLKKRDILRHIPAGARMEDMWTLAVKQGESSFDVIPINKITDDTVKAYAWGKFAITLSLLTKAQRDIVYPILLERLVDDSRLSVKALVIKEAAHPALFAEYITYLSTHSLVPQGAGAKAKFVTLFRFEGIELTGAQATQIAANSEEKLIKLTNYSEKHRHVQYKDGKNEDVQAFNTSQYASAGGLYCTTDAHKGNWLNYNNSDVGAMYWRRPVTFEKDARVYIESDHKIKCNAFLLGARERL